MRDFLEKKFGANKSGQDAKKTVNVVLVSDRTIEKKQTRKGRHGNQIRPYSRTLTAVHKEWLDDVVFPNVVTGKRTLYKSPAGKQVTTAYLPADAKPDLAPIWSGVYKDLTSKAVNFQFDAPRKVKDDDVRKSGKDKKRAGFHGRK